MSGAEGQRSPEKLKDLSVIIPNDHVWRSLTSCFLILFSGLSGAPDRVSTIQELTVWDIQLTPWSLYFQTSHDKQGNTRNTKECIRNELGRHKCPPSTVPYVFLYRLIYHSLAAIKDDGNAIKKMFQQSIMPHCSGQGIRKELAMLWQVDESLISDAKQMRQFFTTVINLVTGAVPKSISASDAAAKCSSHTPATHKRSYASTVIYGDGERSTEEVVFSRYHESLGELEDTSLTSIGSLTRDDYIKALNMLGYSSFRNKEQEDLIRLSNIGSTKHLFGLLTCGAGKTLPLHLAIIVCLLKNYSPGMRILIVPYKFLCESLLCSIKEKTSGLFAGEIRVQGYGADSIGVQGSLPSDLQSNYPNILILTLDAAANLVRGHFNTVKNWAQRKILSAVFIDEAQILLSESLFRPHAVESLNNWASVGVQVVCLSGSFPSTAIPSVMKYLGLAVEGDGGDCSDIEKIQSEHLVPSGFFFDVVNGDKHDLTKHAVEITIHKLKNIGGSVHIMCQTKKQCTDISKLLSAAVDNKEVSCQFDVVMSSEENAESSDTKDKAENWRNGSTKVLITTTAGLVGNESPYARHVIIVGVIYNIINLLQCMGRLRPEQCEDGNASVTQLFENNEDFYSTASAEKTIEYLLDKGVISYGDELSVRNWVHPKKYLEALCKECCKFVALDQVINEFKNKRNKCDQCTWCTQNKPFIEFSQYKKDLGNSKPCYEVQQQHSKKRRISSDNQCVPWPSSTNKSDRLSDIEKATEKAMKDHEEHKERKLRVTKFFNDLACNHRGKNGCFYCGQDHKYNDCEDQKRYRGLHRDAADFKDWLKNHNICTSCYGPYEMCIGKCAFDDFTIRKLLYKKRDELFGKDMEFGVYVRKHYCSEHKRYLLWDELRKENES